MINVNPGFSEGFLIQDSRYPMIIPFDLPSGKLT